MQSGLRHTPINFTTLEEMEEMEEGGSLQAIKPRDCWTMAMKY